MNLNKILLVEDDPNLGQILKDYLEVKGFQPTLHRDGKSALRAFKSEVFQLCIFDVMMPIMDGFTLAEEVRKIEKDVPIIFLTAKSMKEDAIKGLQLGADDYITKPFSMEELLLRINAILRRTARANVPATGVYQIGNFTYDAKIHILSGMGEEIKLTSKEAELLEMLCQYKNQVLERSKALRQVWGDDNYFNSRSMDVYITKLRKYLKADERIQIMNIHGTGYKLIVPEE
ncbi:MAG: response regulator transcription factor [Cytophagales bacterium]|nr:response regulator transcription factor [Bernardetiaceae bacterium]MDW8206153.1 response regulator transcription factor [Cytophagales bacterium]